jgi:hypothetical protein
MHACIANVGFLNAPVYKTFFKKMHKLQNKYVRFNPHPCSLDGSAVPLEKTLKDLGFHDINAVLANMVEALENATVAPKRSVVAKDGITALMKNAITEGNQTLKHELKVNMKILKEDILVESYMYTDIMTQDL